MAAETKRRYTLEEYLALERESDARLEFWEGEVFVMSGGTLAHERILRNAYDLLRSELGGTGCEVFGSNMQIKTPTAALIDMRMAALCAGRLKSKDPTELICC